MKRKRKPMNNSNLPKKRVFLTGATGNMGWSVFQELLKRRERFEIAILARPSKKNKEKLKDYINSNGIEIVWGDLTNYSDILNGVTGSDFVLHVGGMVSPYADSHPKETMDVNITSAQHIVKAVKSQPNCDEIGVIYVGSVAQMGNRLSPKHWGRAGDPICTSIFDWYSVSKSISELIFSESGLKKWASIRQSGMLYPALLNKANDPITYHVPLSGVLEWSTVEDSGRVLANACEDWVPEQFWRGFYNLSSGPTFRLTNYQFESLLLKTISCPTVEKVFEPNWFATKNFHGMWYLDSDRLEDMLRFREGISCEDYFKRLKSKLPWYFSLAKFAPSWPIKRFMKHIASSNQLGTLYWFNNDNDERIKAHFGSRKEWEKIPSWGSYKLEVPSQTPLILDHGYDESKPTDELGIEDLRNAAQFRGGELLSEEMNKGDLFTPLKWRCQFGHTFEMTPNSVLKGGHWCPDCLPKFEGNGGAEQWNFEETAKGNKFFAQLFDFKDINK